MLVCIILYLSYLIVSYKYKEYKINTRIDYLEQENSKIAAEIKKNKETLEYLNTRAYKNKLLKEEQSLKNKWEKVIFITNEETYNTFAKDSQVQLQQVYEEEKTNIYDTMTIFQKWMYFLFKKDTRNT